MPDDSAHISAAKILICEDETAIAQCLARILERLGYVVAGLASRGEEAVQRAEMVKPDLILMDIVLAGEMDGIGAAELIHSRMDVPIVYLTGHAEKQTLERAKQTQPYGYLRKPVGSLELRSTLEIAMYKHGVDRQVRKTSDLLAAMSRAQRLYISGVDPHHVFDGLLSGLLSLTKSEYGFIDEIFHTAEGAPYRVTRAITEIAWNEEMREFYQEHVNKGFVFYNHNNLSGATMVTGKAVISNDPANDPRRGGIPKGHPRLDSFLGLPLYTRQRLIGTAGLANRPGGYEEKIANYLEPYLGTCANIIEAYRNEERRNHAEAVLRDSEQRYRTILSTAMDGFSIMDVTGKILEVNDAYCKISGYTHDELLGMNIAEMEVVETQEHIAAHFRKVVAEGIDRFETVHRLKDGRNAHMEVSAHFLDSDGGNLFMFLRDITDRREAEDQIRTALKEKEVLLREIHHRVKNNLALVASLLNIQSQYAADERHRKMFQDSVARIRSMALAHEKLYQSQNLADLNVPEFISSLVDHLVADTASLGTCVKLKKAIDPVSLGPDTVIPLGFILTELVCNCLKHAFPDGSKGEIEISLRSIGEDGLELVVSDNGIGIPEGPDLENSRSLGLNLVDIFTKQLKGTKEIRRSDGTEVRIRFKELQR